MTDYMLCQVEAMLSPHNALPKAKKPHEAEALRGQIAAAGRQIDNMVHELNGLNEDDIGIVKGEWECG